MSKTITSAYDNRFSSGSDICLLAAFILGAIIAAFNQEAAKQLPLCVCMLSCFTLIFLLSLCVSGLILIPVCTVFFGGITLALCQRIYFVYGVGAANDIWTALIPLITVPAFFLSASLALQLSAVTFRAVRKNTRHTADGILKTLLAILLILAPAVICTVYLVF